MKFKSALLIAVLLFSGNIWAEDTTQTYEVTITNLTKSINFTPILVASHNRNTALFTLGQVASAELVAVAEGGDTSAMQADLMSQSAVLDTTTTSGLLGPGESTTIMIDADNNHRLLSLVSMLLPTNDTIVAVDSVKLPRNRSVVAYGKAYDAGSEENDELCSSIPGPTCGGEPFSEGMAEGYVYVSNGINGQGDLDPAEYTWQNPVLKVSIHLLRDQ